MFTPLCIVFEKERHQSHPSVFGLPRSPLHVAGTFEQQLLTIEKMDRTWSGQAAPLRKMDGTSDAALKVWAMCCDIVGTRMEFVPDASLADLGIDELGLAKLLFQIGQEFGEGLVSAEDVSSLLRQPPPAP